MPISGVPHEQLPARASLLAQVTDLSKDDEFFGARAGGDAGHCSPVAVPAPG